MRIPPAFFAFLFVTAALMLFRDLVLNDQPSRNLQSLRPQHSFLADRNKTKISSNVSKTNTQAQPVKSEPASSDYHSILKNSKFYGKWVEKSNSTRAGFRHQEGLIVMKGSKIEPQNVELTLFDGHYIDKKSIDLHFDFEANSPKVSAENGSVIFERLWVSKRRNEYTYLHGMSDYCLANSSILFVDVRTNQPLDISKNFDPEFVRIEITMDNAFCPFKFSASLIAKDIQTSEIHKKAYAGSTLALIIFQCAMTFILCNTFTTKPSQAEKVSVYSFMSLTAMDFYMLMINAGSLAESFALDITVALFTFFLCISMQKVIWMIACIQTEHMNLRSRFKTLWILNLWSCAFKVLPAVASLLFNSNFIFYFTFGIFGLPQIIKNSKDSRKYRVKLWPVAGLLLPKIFFMAYMKLDKDNIFRYSPDPKVFWVCLGMLTIQAAILMIQSRWPRFGFEGKPSYLFFEPGIINPLQDICSICLEQCRIDIKSTAKSAEPLLKEDSIKQKMVRTLCNHEFHNDCLRNWLRAKLECPYCRRALSPMPGPDDQD